MFMLSRMQVGNTPPIVYMPPTADEAFQVGEALKVAGGKVTKASGTDTPSHVCVGPIGKDGSVPCVEVQDYMEFATTLAAAPASGTTLVIGSKVTLHTDGLQVTATTTGGIAEITSIAGQAVGDAVAVKF